jgi:peptide/nickel transport system substrate-binding protein
MWWGLAHRYTMADQNVPLGTRSIDLDRRKLLQTAGIAGAGMLAGCVGGDGDGSNGGGGQAFVGAETTVIDQMQFNPYNEDNYGFTPGYLLYDNLVYYQADVDEFQPGIVTDWEVTDDSVTLEIREEVPWHDGDEVTAEDVARKLKLDIYDGSSLDRYASAEGVEVTDDYTVEMELEISISEEIFLNSIQGDFLDVSEDPFQEVLEDFEDGGDGVTSDDETLAELAIDEPNGTGPFEYSDRTEQELILELVDDHPDAEEINFSEYQFRYFEDNQGQWQALQSGDIDGVGILEVPPETYEGFPEEVEEFQITPNWGASIIFDHDHEHFGQREVRQAIAHVIDREDVASASGPRTKTPVDIPTGIAGNFETDGSIPANEWLDDSGAFESYEGQDFDRAADLLESAGFQQDDGTWYDADGDVLEFSIKAPGGWTDYVDAIQSINQQLNDFGIEAEFVSRDDAAFFGEDIYGDEGFDVAMFQWTTGQSYPYFNFEFLLDSDEQEEVLNYPDEVEVPPVGNPDGSTETHVPAEELEELLVVDADSSEETELIQQFAWHINQNLPVLPIQETIDQSFVRTDDWETVSSDDSDAHVDWPMTYLPRVGKLSARDA